MDKFGEQLKKCLPVLDNIYHMVNVQQISCEAINYRELYDELYQLVPLIPAEYYIFRNRLRDVILPNLKVPDMVSINQYGQQIVTPCNGINPYTYGEVIATISYLNEFIEDKAVFSIWDAIHPQIKAVVKSRFDDGYYADAVEAAFKEINVRVKKICRERAAIEKDGHNLMTDAFSVNHPIIKLGDISTETGLNEQRGYMEMFAGAMSGIRNPQAHNNQMISKMDAVRILHFASMLMYKIDQEIV